MQWFLIFNFETCTHTNTHTQALCWHQYSRQSWSQHLYFNTKTHLLTEFRRSIHKVKQCCTDVTLERAKYKVTITDEVNRFKSKQLYFSLHSWPKMTRLQWKGLQAKGWTLENRYSPWKDQKNRVNWTCCKLPIKYSLKWIGRNKLPLRKKSDCIMTKSQSFTLQIIIDPTLIESSTDKNNILQFHLYMNS